MGIAENLTCYMPLTSNLDFLVGTAPPTFTRTSTATYISKGTGLVTTATSGEARFEAEGLLMEGASTNLFLRSEEFDNAAWAKSASTVAANATTAPDGNLTAEKLVEDTGTVSPKAIQARSITAGSDFTISCFIKASERSFMRIEVGNAAFTHFMLARFDTATGTIVEQTTGGDGAITSVKMEALPGGWFRCSISGSIDPVTTVITTNLRIMEDASGGSYTGDGASGIFIWGAQQEELSAVSSYIHTITTTVTRATDQLKIPVANLPVNADYSIGLTFIERDAVGAAQFLYGVQYTAGGDVRAFVTGTPTVRVEIAGSGQAGAAITYDTEFRSLATYKNSTAAVNSYLDGVLESGSPMSGITQALTPTDIFIGANQIGTTPTYGHLSEFRIYDIELDADEAVEDFNFDFFSPGITSPLTFSLTRPLTSNLTG